MSRSRTYSHAPNPSGVHFLSAPGVIRDLIRSSGVGEGDLVIDFGAGPGAVTGPLSETGSRVLAVERDSSFVRQLTRRFGDHPQVRVVHDDVRTVSLPRRDFSVVASIPYAVSTTLLRRLLTTPRRPLARADLVVEWGFAQRVVAARTQETAWWATRFDLRVVRRVDAKCFRPAPRVDSAHLVIRRRDDVGGMTQRALWTLLDTAFATPGQPVKAVVPRRLWRAGDVDPASRVSSVQPAAWIRMAKAMAGDPGLHCPPLPARLNRS